MRGQSRDYDQWAELTGDAEWRWERCLPSFKQHEDFYKGADEVHGAGGEWRVERQRLRWDILDAFAQAAQQAGIPAHRGLQPRRQRGRGLLRGQPEGRLALEHRQGLPAPDLLRPPQLRDVDRRAGAAAASSSAAPTARLRCTGARGAGPAASACRSMQTREVLLCAGASARRSCCSCRASAPARCCTSTASPVRARVCPASARTCRTTCRSVPCSRCAA